ncbi:hypothetical protein [Kutzneria sp. NPDC052558]|uniref:hypothetical protein n=1 Tax=Kutzneria sp. NPDC052558 TaxID=3364121 RepID=UPI0037C78AEE
MTYTYLIADTRTGLILDELPLTGVSFDKKLNDTGTFRGSLQVTDPNVSIRDPRVLTTPGRSCLYVDRDGVLLWGGIIWTTTYAVATGSLEIGAADFLSYFEHRFVLGTPLAADPSSTPPVTYTDVDQLAIARDLVGTAQSHPGGDLGIGFTGPDSSGVTRSLAYAPGDLKVVADALKDLATAAGGFDFVVDVRYGDDGRPLRELRAGFPRLGQAGGPFVWEFGANMIDFSWPQDASVMGNRAFTQGSGGQALGLAAADPAGWPLLELTTSQIDTADPGLLADWAAGTLAAQGRPVALPELTVRADAYPQVGLYEVGDDARMVVDDLFFPGQQLDVTMRILSLAVTPGDEGQEEVQLTVSSFEQEQ